MTGPISGVDVRSLLREAQLGIRRIAAEPNLARLEQGGATWEANGRRAIAGPAPTPIASGVPVAIYTAEGDARRYLLGRAIGRPRHETVSLPVTVAGAAPISVPGWRHNPATSDVNDHLDAGMKQAINAAADLADPGARGVFLVGDSSGFQHLELRPLELVTSRGALPLRVDGPTQVLMGSRQLVVEPGKPPPRFYVEGANPALVGIVDQTGGTKGFHHDRILAVVP